MANIKIGGQVIENVETIKAKSAEGSSWVDYGKGGGSPSTGDATATAANILAGKTAYVATGKVTGTMPIYDGTLREG